MKKQLALILAATLALSTGAALAEEAAATEKVVNKPADVSSVLSRIRSCSRRRNPPVCSLRPSSPPCR